MSNERFNAALNELQRSVVSPQLVSDDSVRGLEKSRTWTLWWLAPVGVLALFGVYWLLHTTILQYTLQPSGLPIIRNSGARVPETLLAWQPDTTNAVSRAPVGAERDTIDPNSILIFHLSEAELAALGIAVNDDTVFVTMQSLVVEDTAVAKRLGLDGKTLKDSSALFHWRCSATSKGVDNIVPTSFDGTKLDPLVPFWVQTIDSDNRPQNIRYIQQAIVDREGRDNEFLSGTMSLLHSVSLDSTGCSAHLPTRELARDRKPVIIQVPNRRTRHRVVLLYAPTEDLLTRLPAKYQRATRLCYDAYKTSAPKPTSYPQALPPPEANLVKIEGVMGQPFVELTDVQLSRFGITRDSVSVVCGSFGTTLDTMLTSYRRFETLAYVGNTDPIAHFIFRSGVVYKSVNGREIRETTQPLFPRAKLETVEAEGVNRIAPVKTRSSSISYRISSGAPTGWYAEFPYASALAEKVAHTIGSRRDIPVDSLAYYWVVENGVRVPVTRLLIPIKVSTPWVSSLRFETSPRRLTSVYWYLPTSDVIDSLPADLAAFLKPEYEAVIRSIEDRLSAHDLCSLLDKPSALGLCSIGDTVLRLDGIGPIPARDEMTIFLRSAKATTATITVVNDAGQTVLERAGVGVEKGNNTLRLDVSSTTIARGAYTVVVRTDLGMRTSRVLIER